MGSLFINFYPFGDPNDTFMQLLLPLILFNPQSTLVYGLPETGVLVLLGSWDFPHLKLIPLPLFQCWMSTHERLCNRSHQKPMKAKACIGNMLRKHM